MQCRDKSYKNLRPGVPSREGQKSCRRFIKGSMGQRTHPRLDRLQIVSVGSLRVQPGLREVNKNSSGWTLQRILSTHVRLEVPGLLFRLNLIVVRLVSGFPGLVRASPSLFHSWVALQVFGNDRSSAFSTKFRLQFGIFSSFRRMHFIVASPSPSSSSSLLSPA